MSTPKLSSGLRGFTDSEGRWICTGSQMGRPNYLEGYEGDKLHLYRLKMSRCGCYDVGGAYWGNGLPIFRAVGQYGGDVEIFTRARNRAEAKAYVLSLLPEARFYR